MNRVKEKYQKDVVPALTKEFGYTNVMAVPRLRKVVVNMGLGEATGQRQDRRHGCRRARAHHGAEAGGPSGQEVDCRLQAPQGHAVGTSVTLRGDRMWEFLDRLMSIALPARP